MIIPEYLKPGDKIGIVSTASKIDKEIVFTATNYLKKVGYEVVWGNNVFADFHQFAGTDEQRATDFQMMLDNKDIRMILCSRGGYGSLRTIQDVNWNTFLKSPKWVVGFSDVTVIHSQLNLLNVASIHGVMPRYFLKNNQATKSLITLLNAVSGSANTYSFSSSKYNRTGTATGELIGGNLSILYSLRGTPYDINTDNKILFIEDLSEHLYHLDRIMMNLKTGYKLSKLKGLLVGSFTGMKDNSTPYGKTVEEIILDAVAEYEFPVVFNFPAGHQEENYTLTFGKPVTINISNNKVEVKQT